MRSTGCDRRQQASASLRFLWLLQTPVSPDSHQISPVITEYHPLSPKPLARLAVKVPQGQSRLKDFPLPTPPNPSPSEHTRLNPPGLNPTNLGCGAPLYYPVALGEAPRLILSAISAS